MEHTLRCNSLKCRKELGDQGVVTTCSHIFCVDCSNRFQLPSGPNGQRPMCPACDMHLTNPDDVVVTTLNPTEDYKTSVLSGLSPNVIMECAGRALSFWAYQTTQEIVYQEYLAKNLTDKYTYLNTQMDKIIHDANGEISNMRDRMSALAVDQENLRRKNEELIQAYREKCRKQLQTQELYDKLKRRTMLVHVQDAASDAVDHTIQASVEANRFCDSAGPLSHQPIQPPNFQSQQRIDSAIDASSRTMEPPLSRGTNAQNDWAGFSSQVGDLLNNPRYTPSTHRQRLATVNTTSIPGLGLADLQPHRTSGTPLLHPN
ncbi:hypothetical protein B0O99DRAFT_561201, partial [Bisporella sp. PMI_857]